MAHAEHALPAHIRDLGIEAVLPYAPTVRRHDTDAVVIILRNEFHLVNMHVKRGRWVTAEETMDRGNFIFITPNDKPVARGNAGARLHAFVRRIASSTIDTGKAPH